MCIRDRYDGYVTDQAKEAMTKDGTFPFDAATVDGELYGIPWVQPRIETCHALFVNEKWRKDNGLPEPDTWENFEKMIYAFADGDPNGNGIKDCLLYTSRIMGCCFWGFISGKMAGFRRR